MIKTLVSNLAQAITTSREALVSLKLRLHQHDGVRIVVKIDGFEAKLTHITEEVDKQGMPSVLLLALKHKSVLMAYFARISYGDDPQDNSVRRRRQSLSSRWVSGVPTWNTCRCCRRCTRLGDWGGSSNRRP